MSSDPQDTDQQYVYVAGVMEAFPERSQCWHSSRAKCMAYMSFVFLVLYFSGLHCKLGKYIDSISNCNAVKYIFYQFPYNATPTSPKQSG